MSNLFNIIPIYTDFDKYIIFQYNKDNYTKIIKNTYDNKNISMIQIIIENPLEYQASDYEYAIISLDFNKIIWNELTDPLLLLSEGVYIINIRNKSNNNIIYTRTIELQYIFGFTIQPFDTSNYQIIDTALDVKIIKDVSKNINFNLLINILDHNIIKGNNILIQCKIDKLNEYTKKYINISEQKYVDTPLINCILKHGIYNISISYTYDDMFINHQRTCILNTQSNPIVNKPSNKIIINDNITSDYGIKKRHRSIKKLKDPLDFSKKSIRDIYGDLINTIGIDTRIIDYSKPLNRIKFGGDKISFN